MYLTDDDASMAIESVPLNLGSLEYSQCKPGSDGRSQFATANKVGLGDRLWCEYLCRCLRMRADNEWLGDRLQAPTGGYARDLPRCTFTVRAGAYHDGVRAPLNPAKNRVVAAIEKCLHLAGHACEVFGADEEIAVCDQQVVRFRSSGIAQHHFGLIRSSSRCCLGHLFAAAGARMPDNEQGFQKANSRTAWATRSPEPAKVTLHST